MRRNRLLIVITLLVGLMLACNVSIGNSDTSPTSTPMVLVITQLVPADTVVPQVEATTTTEVLATDEPVVQPTSTASAPVVTPLKDPVNCRFGPSIFYEQVFALNVGAYMPVVGKSADGGWWLAGIPNGNNQACWVGATVTTITGDISGIPVVPAPQAFIIDVKLQIDRLSVNLGPTCSSIPSSPFTLKGIITTNGPLEIAWYAETQQDGRLPEHTLKFAQFGPQVVVFNFAPTTWKKGNFWIRIVITKPKSMVSDITYQVKCQ